MEEEPEEIDDEPVHRPAAVLLPAVLRAPYLKERGFTGDDFEYFPVGTTRGLNRRWDDYVIFPILDGGDTAGYVARHTWPKG